MNLLQSASSLGRNGIANVMRGIAGVWSGETSFAVLDPRGSGTHMTWTPPGLWGRRKMMNLWSAPAVNSAVRFMKTNDVNAVLAHYPPLDAIVFKAAERLGLPRAYYYHNVTPVELSAASEKERRCREDASMLKLMTSADAVFVNSEYTAEKVRQRIGIEAVVASPAVDLEKFKSADRIEDGRFRIVHLGRAVPHKGVKELLENLGPLLDRHSHLQLDYVGGIGDDAYGQSCRQLLQREQVTWHQGIDDAVVARLLGEADVFISGSRFEGFGMPFLEAAACGTPSLGFSCAAILEAVSEGQTGRLVGEGDWPALINILESWIAEPATLQALTDQCRSYAVGRDWNSVAESVAQGLRA